MRLLCTFGAGCFTVATNGAIHRGPHSTREVITMTSNASSVARSGKFHVWITLQIRRGFSRRLHLIVRQSGRVRGADAMRRGLTGRSPICRTGQTTG